MVPIAPPTPPATFPLRSLCLPLAVDAAPLLSPLLILGLCVLAGIGTVLLLPGRRGIAWRRIGGALVAVAFIFLGLGLFIEAEYRSNVYFWIFSAIALLGSIRVITHPKPVYSALYFVLTVFASAGLFVLLYAEFMAVALVTIYAGAILVTYTFVIMLAADASPPKQPREEAVREFVAEHDARARAPWSAAAVGFLTMGVLLFVIFDRAPGVLEPRLSLTEARYLEQPDVRQVPGALGVDAEGDEVAEAETGVADAPLATDPDLAAADASPRGDLYAVEEQRSYASERGGIQVLGIYLFTRQMVSLQIAGLILTVAMIGAIVIARKQVISELRPGGLSEAEREGDRYTTPFTPADDNPKSLPVKGSGDRRQKAYPQN